MGKLKAAAFSISLDGFGAAPSQSLENPFGVGGMVLPAWMLKTRYFHKMIGKEGGDTGVADGDDVAPRQRHKRRSPAGALALYLQLKSPRRQRHAAPCGCPT